MTLEDKIASLLDIIKEYSRVAVAFSGGVDSSLLLKCALDSLGAGNVLILHGSSCLEKAREQNTALSWPQRHGYKHGVSCLAVDLHPLDWKEFVQNSPDRCYLCKLRMYKRFLEEAEVKGFHCLLDGTNTDDLKDGRPGLRAIHQLGIKTPLLAAGLNKHEIRQASKILLLDSWSRHTESCLATRIPQGMTITAGRLQLAGRLEELLEGLGVEGCRVRLGQDEQTALITLRETDQEKLGVETFRLTIQRSFAREGVHSVYVNLSGR